LKASGNLKLTQQILGHSDIKNTMKYAHILDEQKRAVLNSLFPSSCTKPVQTTEHKNATS